MNIYLYLHGDNNVSLTGLPGAPEKKIFVIIFGSIWASLVAQIVKNLPAMRETQIQPLGQEKAPKKEMEIHSSILSWRTPWTEEPGWLQSMESQRVGHS